MFLVMKTKEFLGGILDRDVVPQVLNFYSGVPVQCVVIDADEVADYISGLGKYERLLLKLRINRRSREAGYAASHAKGFRKEDVQRLIQLSEFWSTLAAIAAPYLNQ